LIQKRIKNEVINEFKTPSLKKKNAIEIWKNRNKILEGLRNSVFKRDDVELIANERIAICRSNECGFHDPNGISEAAVAKGKESCGSCGCKLSWKTRSLSSNCPINSWEAILSETEEAALNNNLGIEPD
jgi:hypothetical protein